MPGCPKFGASFSLVERFLWTFIFLLHLCHVAAFSFPQRSTHLSSADAGQFGQSALHALPIVRWGEAQHPGPYDDCHLFGFSNPSGLRQKEPAVISLGPGVWSFSETQLSWVTQRSCAHQLRSLAAAQHRQVRVHMGAPVATRVNSEWAGTWAGVATCSDFPSQEVMLPYTVERECGRMLATRHFIGNCPVLNVVVYGYPRGPTWPEAPTLTNSLLNIITTEVVLGGTGPRLIGGDFNSDSRGLPVFDFWRQLGWLPAQELAYQLWQQEMQFSCKHATERDLIWLSPEAVALCRFVDVADVFAEHATVTVGLHIPSSVPPSLAWPRPSRIPWPEVDPQWYEVAWSPSWTSEGDVNAVWAEWASSFETSLDGFVQHQPAQKLTRGQRGRLSKSKPSPMPSTATILRPSRPSEVQLRNDLIGSEVKIWFRQLRRLQSYAAAIRANKQTCSAIAYRIELWSAILASPGFRDGFSLWWQLHRNIGLPDTPRCLPSAPPTVSLADSIFATFKCNFEDLESWHLRQRSKLLQMKYDKGMQGLYQDLKPPQRDRLDLLQDQHSFAVLAVDHEVSQIHLDSSIPEGGLLKWTFEGTEIFPQRINEVVLQLPDVSQLASGDILELHQIFSATEDLHERLLSYWRPTWCAMATIPPETWKRVIDFFQAHVPQFQFALEPITIPQWHRILRRFKPTAARGVDGVSHLDLLALPDVWTQRLLDLLHAIEQGESCWPDAVLYGVVSVLAKESGAHTVDRFRPVVIFSVIYRAWASLRAKQLLRMLTPHMDVEAYGFMPGCEPSQLWLLLQAEVECALQDGTAISGLSTDLTRAFNFIPRQHTFALATHLGVPLTVVHPWCAFLTGCTRAFDVRGVLSPCTTSTCGLPEGDALSVFGMTQLCFAWHLYMRVYCPEVRSMSFVDNLGLTSCIPGLLAQGLVCLVEFFKLWNLSVDNQKSYCWALTDTDKRQMAVLPFQRVDHAHELGGVLSFTRRRFTGLQQKRIARLSDKWKRLQHSRAPLQQKLMALPAAFWTSALYGINGSCLGEHHIDDLRKQAVRALRLNGAGANGLLRLSLSRVPTADPGFWRLKMTVKTFQRLLLKEPRLICLWKIFMSGFRGNLFSGPFSQLLVVLNQVGWRVEPPCCGTMMVVDSI